MQKTQVTSLGQEDPMEKEMATTPVFWPGKSHGQRSLAGHSPAAAAAAAAKSLQSCPTLCDPIDNRSPVSSVHGIFQARILELLPFPSPGDLPNP